ncbi:MAG: imidazoleglycerol-phosphate dehydratase HisB [Clostridia bacterium]|nr:imidazoleglycerol-phosphate dehydratase HisB [Clostridia bacterium]
MRQGVINRRTKETDITISLNLDGEGKSEISTGSGFFNHMLELFASHGRFDLKVRANGDTDVDFHHSAEDIGIVLGTAFKDNLGDKRGIKRYADIILPMDEALILCALDFSGRSYLAYDVTLKATKLSDNGEEMSAIVGSFDTELVEEFLLAFVRSSGLTLHIKQLAGTNTHHILEGVFKAFARALREAVSYDEKFKSEIPSTKGSL